MSLPKGYRMWISPTYRLETPKVTVTLPPEHGPILAMLIGRYRKPVFLGDTMASLHGMPDNGGPVSYTTLIQGHVDYLRNYLRQYGIAAMINVVPGHDCAVLRHIKHVGPKADQTPYGRMQANRMQANRATTKGMRRYPDQPLPPYHDPRADADPEAVVPYARLARHEMAEQSGFYERPLTNEELRRNDSRGGYLRYGGVDLHLRKHRRPAASTT